MIQSYLNKHILNTSPPKLSQQLALMGKNHSAVGKMSNLKTGFFYVYIYITSQVNYSLCEGFQHFYRVSLMSSVSETIYDLAGIYAHILFPMMTLPVFKLGDPKLGKYFIRAIKGRSYLKQIFFLDDFLGHIQRPFCTGQRREQGVT